MTVFARVRSLTDGLDRSGQKDLETAIARVAEALRDAGERGALQLDLGGDHDTQSRSGWTVMLAEHRPLSGRVDNPDVEVITSVEAFWEMVDGSLSPVEAFRSGRMRVRGDEELAKRILRHLAGPDGAVGCP